MEIFIKPSSFTKLYLDALLANVSLTTLWSIPLALVLIAVYLSFSKNKSSVQACDVWSGQHRLLTFSLISYVVNLFRPTPTVSGLLTSISRKLFGGPYASFRFCGLVYSLLVSAMASAMAFRYRFEKTSSYRLHFRSAEEQLTCDIPTRSRGNIPGLWLD